MSLRKKAVRTIRRIAGDDSKIETTLRAARDRTAYRSGALSKQTTAVVFKGDDTKFGIYGFGGCDVWAIAESGGALRKATSASGATWAAGRAQYTRSDLILQAYDGVDPEVVAEVSERLHGTRPAPGKAIRAIAVTRLAVGQATGRRERELDLHETRVRERAIPGVIASLYSVPERAAMPLPADTHKFIQAPLYQTIPHKPVDKRRLRPAAQTAPQCDVAKNA